MIISPSASTVHDGPRPPCAPTPPHVVYLAAHEHTIADQGAAVAAFIRDRRAARIARMRSILAHRRQQSDRSITPTRADDGREGLHV
jgi:hypothetical protein